MAAKSTRKQITTEARKMLYDIENAMFRLKRIEELALNGSPVVTESVPPLVEMFNTVHSFVEAFRSKL